jgi:hypothetical protein
MELLDSYLRKEMYTDQFQSVSEYRPHRPQESNVG